MLDNRRIDAFLDTLRAERGAADNTIEAYRRDLEDASSFLRANKTSLVAAGERDLSAFVRDLHERGLSDRDRLIVEQIAELDRLGPRDDEWPELNAEHRRLSHAQAMGVLETNPSHGVRRMIADGDGFVAIVCDTMDGPPCYVVAGRTDGQVRWRSPVGNFSDIARTPDGQIAAMVWSDDSLTARLVRYATP